MDFVFAQEEPTTGIYNPVISRDFGTGEGAEIVAELIGKFLNLAFMIGGAVLLAMIIISGFQWMTAGGDKQAVSAARGRLTSAIIGFIILASTYAILSFVGDFLEVKFLQELIIEWPTPQQ